MPMINKGIGLFRVLQKVLDRQLLQKEATIQLDLSIRQVKRLVKSLREKGSKVLISPQKRKLQQLKGL